MADDQPSPGDDRPSGSNDRFEVTDDAGVSRLVLGLIDARTALYGLSVRDAAGRERLTVGVDDTGPSVVMVQGGNIALHVGVDDPLLAGDHTGAYVVLADRDGRPVLQITVEEDGSLHISTGDG